ncbi:MAG: holo-ACP synthase [Planctomycetota bacterium]|jgi:holo-[acyl-carrier protein] synthase
MIRAVGIDMVAIDRIGRLLDRYGSRFLDRVFTDLEQSYCRSKRSMNESLAARFAAKEAVMKCLGTGWAEGVAFDQIEVQRDSAGAVRVVLSGRAAERAAELEIARIHLSISHDDGRAIAMTIAEG